MSCIHNPANKYGIPVVALATMSAVATHCHCHHQTFVTEGLVPLPAPDGSLTPESNSWFDEVKFFPVPPRSAAEAAARKRIVGHVLPGLAPDLKVEELPSSFLPHSPVPCVFQTLRSMLNDLLPDCDCLFVNTFHELEVAALHGMDENPAILPVGPLVFITEYHSSNSVPLLGDALCSLWEEDPATLHWLEAQQPGSVIYVSFGSLATLSVAQLLMEIAHGLELASTDFCGSSGKAWWKEKTVTMTSLIFCHILEWLPKTEVS